ncbi:winged helix-turn-helix domain-containing protein [Amycolatopsis sp. A133]|uniref:ArsR/SmtB family transcription factor n=1 Tax=Amycolatopsis sp. A133 TaxID=3064472 RepID=UPI0027EACE31|nr:winged helix-turn-helix domain-containing protein [Amycolatopsis sp. A133]MDQ7807233.1 winged helix-turn-helix domain-containing protein [Amycolatopsis sp. A133]
MRIGLTLQDLVRTRLAAAADPMGELTGSLQVLQRRDGGRHAASAAFTRWRHRVRQGLPDSASVLLWLCRPDAPVPEFLLPAAGRYDLESGLAAVLKTDAVNLKTALRTAPAGRDLPAWAAALADGDTAGLPRLVQALQDYHEIALAPCWDVVCAQVDADLGMRTQVLLHGGIDALLTGLRPKVRWTAPVLETDDRIAGTLPSEGTGLLVVPTYFSVGPALVPPAPGGIPRLHHPCVRHAVHPAGFAGRGARKAPGNALADLLGPTRAAALTILAVGCSTSELAARLGVTPSAASKHTTVLRRAGLIITHRERNTVLHSLTPLGSALLDSLQAG